MRIKRKQCMKISEKVSCLASEMSALTSGSLAELRRMDVGGPGTMGYWLLARRCGFLHANANRWMRFVKILAILIPRGELGGRKSLHDPSRHFGAVLCDGGDPNWPSAETGYPRPFVSETRLARFLAQRPDLRPATLERFARMLASQRDPHAGLNCIDVAALALVFDANDLPKNIARRYYQRLDLATRTDKQQETNK